MNLDLSTLPIPLVPYQLPNGMTIYVPGAHATGTPGAAPAGMPQPQSNFSLANLAALGSLGNLQGLPAGGLPDLSGLLPVLAPMIASAVPGIGPFIPIIGAVLHILYGLTTQVHAATASGTPNPALQLVHDSAWSQVLGAFGQKQIAPPTPAAA